MINSALTPIVIYSMCTIRLPRGAIENIDRVRKQCLWRGNTDKKKGGNLVAWDVAQKPKEKGGLGVINLRLQNDALLLKQLHKFYNKEDIPWVNLIWFKYYQHAVPHTAREKGSFWWKDIWRLNTIYRSVSHCIIGDGSSICFWEDKWRPKILSTRYPRLASFARKREVSIQEVTMAESLDELFILPLSQQAHDEFLDLSNELLEVNLDVLSADLWHPNRGSLFTPRGFTPSIALWKDTQSSGKLGNLAAPRE
jgi:hypothetical protein